MVRVREYLQAAGLIVRHEEHGDRRAKAIILTTAGTALVARVEAVAQEVRDHALAELADGELATADRVLRHVAGALATIAEGQGI